MHEVGVIEGRTWEPKNSGITSRETESVHGQVSGPKNCARKGDQRLRSSQEAAGNDRGVKGGRRVEAVKDKPEEQTPTASAATAQTRRRNPGRLGRAEPMVWTERMWENPGKRDQRRKRLGCR